MFVDYEATWPVDNTYGLDDEAHVAATLEKAATDPMELLICEYRLLASAYANRFTPRSVNANAFAKRMRQPVNALCSALQTGDRETDAGALGLIWRQAMTFVSSQAARQAFGSPRACDRTIVSGLQANGLISESPLEDNAEHSLSIGRLSELELTAYRQLLYDPRSRTHRLKPRSEPIERVSWAHNSRTIRQSVRHAGAMWHEATGTAQTGDSSLREAFFQTEIANIVLAAAGMVKHRCGPTALEQILTYEASAITARLRGRSL